MRNNEKYSRNFFHKFLDVHLEKEWGTPRLHLRCVEAVERHACCTVCSSRSGLFPH